MNLIKTEIEGVVEIVPNVFGDERGYFLESYNKKAFFELGIDINFVQDNQSMSKKGVVRGLHFQVLPFAQDKLVSVIKGSVLDVAVDLRKSSNTYGKHVKVILTEQKHNMLLIPKGFAHGFLTLEDNTIFSYKCSDVYNKNAEEGLKWNDLTLNIDWGIEHPIVSEKDQLQPEFKNFKTPFN